MARVAKNKSIEREDQIVQKTDFGKDKLYEKKLWKNVITVWRCKVCSACMDIEDNIIMHVLKHVKESERNNVLDKLMAQKE